MSEVLLEFLAPYRHETQDDAALEKLIALAVVAWNVSLLPESERDGALHRLVPELSGRKRFVLLKRSGGVVRNRGGGHGGVQTATESAEVTEQKAIVRQMIERKLQSFPHNQRMIVGYQVHLSEKDIELVVESTVRPEEERRVHAKHTMEEGASARTDESESI
jgi:hypothetical protein